MFDDLFDDISDVFGDATDGIGDAVDSFSDATSIFDASLPVCDLVPDVSEGIDVFGAGTTDMFADAGDFSDGINIFGVEDSLGGSSFSFGDGNIFGSDAVSGSGSMVDAFDEPMLVAENETSLGAESIFGTDDLEPIQTDSFAEENVFEAHNDVEPVGMIEDSNMLAYGNGDVYEGVDLADNGVGFTSTQENIFGGQDFYENGQLVASSQPNIFGGQDFYDGGELIGSTQENIFGGQDLYDGSQMVASTQPNIFGGQNVFENGTQIASTTPNVFGGIDVDEV